MSESFRPDSASLMRHDDLRVIEGMAQAAREIAGVRDEAELHRTIEGLPERLLGAGTLKLITGRAAQEAQEEGPRADVEVDGKVVGYLLFSGVPESQLSLTLLRGFAGLVGTTLATLRHLELNRQLQQSLQIDRAYFEQLFAAAPEAIVVLDSEDRVVRANREFERLFGYTVSEIEGATINDLIVPPHLQDQAIGLTRAVARGEQVQEEAVRRRKDGSLLHVSILGTPVVVGGDQVAVYGIYRDITVQKEAEETLRRLSTTDELTGLLNRRGFFLLAEQQRRIARRRKADLLLLYIDIDDFKLINDSYGHHEGDQVLAGLGQLLRSCYRDTDILARVGDDVELLARMGGDEFVVLAVDAGQQTENILTDRLRARLAEFNEQRQRPYQVSLSIGAVRVAADPDVTIDSLLASADRSMYRQKRGPLQP